MFRANDRLLWVRQFFLLGGAHEISPRFPSFPSFWVGISMKRYPVDRDAKIFVLGVSTTANNASIRHCTVLYFLQKSLKTCVWSGLKLLWMFAVLFVWPLCSTSMHCDEPSKFLMWRKRWAQSCFLLSSNFENLPKNLTLGVFSWHLGSKY